MIPEGKSKDKYETWSRAEHLAQKREELAKEPKIKVSLTVQHASFSQSENPKIKEARPWNEWQQSTDVL